jgi:hypothetical protein
MPWNRALGAGLPGRRDLAALVAWALAFPLALQAQGLHHGTTGAGAGTHVATLAGPATALPDAAGVALAADPSDVGVTLSAAPVPFGPGERATYQVKFGFLSVGEGRMEVAGLEDVRGRTSYRIDWAIKGGIPGARVNDRWQSWVDVAGLFSHRHIADLREVRYRAYRHWEFFPGERRWVREDNGSEGELASAEPLDDIAFVYYVRTLPLQVGDVYTLPRYFRERGNPVVVRVLRKDRITVPAGTFNTVVVQPVIRTGGLFSEGGKAEIHFSDDHRRILVYMHSKVSFGNLSLHLRSLDEGVPLQRLNMEQLVAQGGSGSSGQR